MPVRSHICLASIPLQTSEHLAAIAHQATALGFDISWVALEPPGTVPSVSAAHTTSVVEPFDLHAVDSIATLDAHFEATHPVAIFIQTPYPEHYPEWFWKSAWMDRMCFAGYGATLSTWDKGLYDLPTLHSCSWLLAESEFNRSKYLDHDNDPSRVVVTGNPLMFELRARLDQLDLRDPARKSILWAPHWSSTWFEHARGFSRWRETVRPLFEFATLHPEITVVARPHPLLLDLFVLPETPEHDADEHALHALLALDNVVLSDRSFVDDILRSDALVTDGVSIIAYFATTGRPLAIMRDSESPPFNEPGELLCAESDLQPDASSLTSWLNHQASRSFSDITDSRQELSARVHPSWSESPVSIWARQAGFGPDALPA